MQKNNELDGTFYLKCKSSSVLIVIPDYQQLAKDKKCQAHRFLQSVFPSKHGRVSITRFVKALGLALLKVKTGQTTLEAFDVFMPDMHGYSKHGPEPVASIGVFKVPLSCLLTDIESGFHIYEERSTRYISLDGDGEAPIESGFVRAIREEVERYVERTAADLTVDYIEALGGLSSYSKPFLGLAIFRLKTAARNPDAENLKAILDCIRPVTEKLRMFERRAINSNDVTATRELVEAIKLSVNYIIHISGVENMEDRLIDYLSTEDAREVNFRDIFLCSITPQKTEQKQLTHIQGDLIQIMETYRFGLKATKTETQTTDQIIAEWLRIEMTTEEFIEKWLQEED